MAATSEIRTDRLVLEPLEPAHAADMVGVLSDPALYGFMGGRPPTLAELADQYRRQAAGSPRSGETWHNWIVHLDGTAIGFVQATVRAGVADLAWVVGVPWQGAGYATEASLAMRDWLSAGGIGRCEAHIHPGHAASGAVAAKLGLRPTGAYDDGGEEIWSSEA